MKKILKAIALIVCLLLPLSAMAMSTIADNELSSVTGQAGVSINLDVNMDVTINTISWGDADGSTWAANIGGTAVNAGWVGLSGLTASGIKVRLRTDLITTALANMGAAATWGATYGTAVATANATITANIGAFMAAFNTAYSTSLPVTTAGLGAALTGSYGDPATIAGYATIGPAFSTLVTDTTGANAAGYNAYVAYSTASAGITPLTIDVATDPAIHGGKTFVRIGFGSLEIGVDTISADVKLGHTNVLEGDTLGSLYVAGLDMKINRSSYVDIYQGSGAQGVVLNLNVKIDSFGITTLAWGDADGLQTAGGWVATSGGGWVGLKNLTIAGLTVVGPIAIDVATTTGNKTYVNIGFGSGLAVGMGSLDATVALGSTTNLNQELGSLYVSNMNATITGAVQVSAHAASGVTLDLNLGIALAPMNVSWGDSDGMGAGTTAGFVGLKNLTIVGLSLAGEVTIDVATVNTDTSLISSTKTLMYAAYGTHQMGPTVPSFVHIGIGSGDPANTSTTPFLIGMTSLATDVVLDGTKQLTSTNAGTLGSLYMAGMSAKVNGWVDIAAH